MYRRSGAKKAHDGHFLVCRKRSPILINRKRNRGLGAGVSDVRISTWLVYLANVAGPVPSVLRIAHERFGSSSDPRTNGHLHYPNDVDRSLNEDAADKIRKYR
jgi:hypothetical protein